MSENTRIVLDVDDVDVTLGRGQRRRKILRDVTFRLGAGEALGLIGETGSGKTTLARAILGLEKLDKGRVRVGATDTTALRGAQWRRFRRSGAIQYVFQDPLKSLDPERTLGQSLAEPLELRGGIPRAGIAERIEDVLRTVALDPDIVGRHPAEVSGGQRQRIAIARALLTDPQVVILDEPVSALDAANRSNILGLLGALRERGVALVFISHDLGSVAGLTDRTLVLYRGQVVEQAETRELVNRPQHPYTRLLVGSAPTLAARGVDRGTRERLRALVAAREAASG